VGFRVGRHLHDVCGERHHRVVANEYGQLRRYFYFTEDPAKISIAMSVSQGSTSGICGVQWVSRSLTAMRL
jgi:hypothetical protein